MSKAYLMTGKAGDLLAIAPILHEGFRLSGQPQNLIVSREYASVVEGLDYVTPIVFDGNWMDFLGALKFAKHHFDRVEVPMTHGNTLTVKRKCPSVFFEQWERVGYLDKWDTLPLVLPRTSKTTLSGPTIFYADHSQSSPFFYANDLYNLIQETFPTHQVMRASGMRLKNLRDFLPIMDSCSLIVSVETSFLHLAKACETPIIAMVASEPDPWRGSPYSKRFAFHCRYGDFMARKGELVAAMVRAVNNVDGTKVEIFQARKKNAYNMTMFDGAMKSGKSAFIYRYHPNLEWKTILALDTGDGYVQDIEFPKDCADYSIEDARFVLIKGQPHISYTCSRSEGGRWYSIQAYGPIEMDQHQWKVTNHIVPKYPGNDGLGSQKNWVPFVVGDKFYFIFGNLKASMEQVILEMDGGKVVKEHRSPASAWAWGGIRGGCVIPFKGQLLRFFHSRTGDTHKPLSFRYYIGASLMDAAPPFATTMVSSFPILAGNEKYTNCSTWKPNCALPYGVIASDDGFVISGGLNDSECFTMKLSVGDLSL